MDILCKLVLRELCCCNNVLGKTNVSRMVVENKDKQKRVISSVQSSNHLGVHTGLANHLVSKKYYWPGMYKDVHK